jgi:hypothetical protein
MIVGIDQPGQDAIALQVDDAVIRLRGGANGSYA